MFTNTINWKQPFVIHRMPKSKPAPTPTTSFPNPNLDIIRRIQSGEFKNVVCLLGAGISVGAGIPDFRTAKSGLFAKFKDYGVPYPEALFERDYFIDDPNPLYKLLKEIFILDPKPTVAHYFLKLLEQEKILSYVFTQNIDGLEEKAGVKEKLIAQVHGNINEGVCIKCKKSMDNKSFKESVLTGKVVYCTCGSLIKPKVLFYEESMPVKFKKNLPKISSADLVFIMGTSMKVSPFDGIVTLIENNTPVILVNKEAVTLKGGREAIFFQGDVQEVVMNMIKELGWGKKLEKILK